MRLITRVNLKVIGADGALIDRRRQSAAEQPYGQSSSLAQKSTHGSDEPVRQGSEFRFDESHLNRFENFQGNAFELSLVSFFYIELLEREDYPLNNVRKLFAGQLRAYRISDVLGQLLKRGTTFNH